MILSLSTVKINNTYNYYRAVAPTPAELAPAFATGETWLDTVTGYSYELIDEVAGTWVRIETDLDAKIEAMADPLVKMVMRYINNYFIVKRNAKYINNYDAFISDFPSGLPAGYNRRDAFSILSLECVYSDFTFDSATFGITGGEIVYGWSEDAFRPDDLILIQGSRRNNGIFTVASASRDLGTIEVDEDLKDEECNATIYLLDIPDAFLKICGMMLWYDICKRPTLTGMQSERIGTYSYTLADMGALNYPADITSALAAYA